MQQIATKKETEQANNQLTEARRIIAELAPLADAMKRLDRAYLESWQRYLARTGDEAQVNERRLVWLRSLHHEYTGAARQAA
jgi:hypothetical protein